MQTRGSKHLLTEAMDWFLVKNNLKIYSVFMGAFFLSTKFWVLGKLDWHRLRAKIKSRSAKSCSGRIKTFFFLGEKILFWSRCLVQMRCRGSIFFFKLRNWLQVGCPTWFHSCSGVDFQARFGFRRKKTTIDLSENEVFWWRPFIQLGYLPGRIFSSSRNEFRCQESSFCLQFR